MKDTCTHDLQLQICNLFLTNKIKLVNNVIHIIEIMIYDLKIEVHCVLNNIQKIEKKMNFVKCCFCSVSKNYCNHEAI